MDQTNQHSHTHLYIVIGLLVVFAVMFLMFKVPTTTEFPYNKTPLELRRIVLTPEQLAARAEQEKDPLLTKKIILTKEQLEQRKKQELDPKLTAVIKN